MWCWFVYTRFQQLYLEKNLQIKHKSDETLTIIKPHIESNDLNYKLKFA